MNVSPERQAEIDAMWSGNAAKLNANVPGRWRPIGAGAGAGASGGLGEAIVPPPTRDNGPQSQLEIDAMYAGYAARLNATLPERWRGTAARRA